MNGVTQHSLPKAPRHADAIAVRTLVAEELVLPRRLDVKKVVDRLKAASLAARRRAGTDSWRVDGVVRGGDA